MLPSESGINPALIDTMLARVRAKTAFTDPSGMGGGGGDPLAGPSVGTPGMMPGMAMPGAPGAPAAPGMPTGGDPVPGVQQNLQQAAAAKPPKVDIPRTLQVILTLLVKLCEKFEIRPPTEELLGATGSPMDPGATGGAPPPQPGAPPAGGGMAPPPMDPSMGGGMAPPPPEPAKTAGDRYSQGRGFVPGYGAAPIAPPAGVSVHDRLAAAAAVYRSRQGQ